MEREFACIKFANLDVTSPVEVADFIEWLCRDRRPSLPPDELARSDELERFLRKHPEELVESLWGWDAPRKRMAKLLWQLLQGNYDDEYFHKRFTLIKAHLIEDAASCAAILPPIQERLHWVLNSFEIRRKEDSAIGQWMWGEEWWLGPEQADFVRQQIRRARLDLIELPSEYEEATEVFLWHINHDVIKAVNIPCDHPDRAYEGRQEAEEVMPGLVSLVNRVYVTVDDGGQWPLPNVRYPHTHGGFGWGYGGSGPIALAESILADALDGDLSLAERFAVAFFEQFVKRWPQDKPFRVTRAEVLQWLESKGLTGDEWERARRGKEERLARHKLTIRKLESRLRRMREVAPQGLRRQRFDLVPPDFECALYLDLKDMLESSFVLLRCAHCNLPIPCGSTGRGRRQLALSRRGVPVYHPECHKEHRRKVKLQYYHRRAQDEAYREARRLQSREARRLKR